MRERAHHVLVDAGRRHRRASERSSGRSEAPRGAPSTQAISPDGPHSQRNNAGAPRRGAGCASGGGVLFAAAPAAFDPRDDFAERRPAGARRLADRGSGVAARPAALDQRIGRVGLGGRGDLGMQGFDETPGLIVGAGEQRAPLRRIEARRGENRRRNRQLVRRQNIRAGRAASGSAATARAAAARSASSTLAESLRIESSASATIGLALLGPARATRSTSCRQRTAVSWRSLAGWFRTVSNRSSNRTGFPASSRRTEYRLYADVDFALRRQPLTIPKRDSVATRRRTEGRRKAPTNRRALPVSGCDCRYSSQNFATSAREPVTALNAAVARPCRPTGERHAEMQVGDVLVDAGLGQGLSVDLGRFGKFAQGHNSDRRCAAAPSRGWRHLGRLGEIGLGRLGLVFSADEYRLNSGPAGSISLAAMPGVEHGLGFVIIRLFGGALGRTGRNPAPLQRSGRLHQPQQGERPSTSGWVMLR